ncbi:glucose-induced degradation protein 8 homolog [Cloeon dipterum]|uniref:CTLH domain-containing protein n=1 Tax=Cloeon dipterum TaxID=197152 RepID=A0A8S1DHS1_9INSE|nr:Hypothetical predicted protein [Cloeon dipterum]
MSSNYLDNLASSRENWLNKLEGLNINRTDMNKLIMNYLVTEGFKEAAEKFKQESGVEPTVDLNSLDHRIRVRDAIQAGNIQAAVAMVNELHPELLDNDRFLYFHLQQLQLIELIRAGRVEEALGYAQEHLCEAAEEDKAVLSELERTLALLGFEQPEQCPFSDLLQPAHRQKVASELNAAILRMEDQEATSPKLADLLRLILWAQEELDKKKIKYPKMVDLADAKIDKVDMSK